ncbi:type III secretion system outer membrane ring subunit SctC [Roseateles sp.]|uniref:type III secretion system outer membrane ring subunit SctC n=1 Tax=Roseateles sp. TaxID=1971397 RepID=UPI0031D2F366
MRAPHFQRRALAACVAIAVAGSGSAPATLLAQDARGAAPAASNAPAASATSAASAMAPAPAVTSATSSAAASTATSAAKARPRAAGSDRRLERRFVYRAESRRLSDVLQDFAASQGVPAVVGDGVDGVVNASFDSSPQVFLSAIAKAYGLIWYDDGTALYFYPARAVQSRMFRLKGYSRREVTELLNSLNLGDKRYPLRFNDAQRTLLAYGPPRHVELIAQALDSLDLGAAEGNERVVRVFPLRFASANDRLLGESNVPGVATILRNLYAAQSMQPDTVTGQPSNPVDQKIKAMQSMYGAGKLVPDLPSATQGAGGPPAEKPGQSGRMLRSPVNFEEDQPRFEADEGTNAVIVQGRAYRMREYEALIQRLDQRPVLVELQAMIIDVSEDNARSLGIDWSVQGNRGQLSVTSPGGGPPQTGGGQGLLGNGTYTIGTLVADAGRQLMLRINAMQGEGKARVVSKPSVLGVANRPAVMKEKRVATVRVAGNLDAKLYQIEAGTLLQVTPQVVSAGGVNQIKLSLYIEDGNFEASSVDQVPVLKKTEIRTEAHVREGESLLIGGLMVEASTDQQSGVPLLKDVPLVGGLFRWSGSRATRTERLFLITPKLVGGSAAAALPQPPAGELDPGAPAAPLAR